LVPISSIFSSFWLTLSASFTQNQCVALSNKKSSLIRAFFIIDYTTSFVFYSFWTILTNDADKVNQKEEKKIVFLDESGLFTESRSSTVRLTVLGTTWRDVAQKYHLKNLRRLLYNILFCHISYIFLYLTSGVKFFLKLV
jgi:hypothetical protein